MYRLSTRLIDKTNSSLILWHTLIMNETKITSKLKALMDKKDFIHEIWIWTSVNSTVVISRYGDIHTLVAHIYKAGDEGLSSLVPHLLHWFQHPMINSTLHPGFDNQYKSVFPLCIIGWKVVGDSKWLE